MANQGRPNTSSATGRKRRRRDPLWARLVVVFGAVLMMLSGIGIVGGKALLARYTGAVTQQNLLGSAGSTKPAGKELEGPLNFLLLGIDERARDPGNTRSDTIMIAHVPSTHDQAYLLSVPRDTWVEVPPFKKSGYQGGHAKITEAFFFGSRNGAGRAGGAELVALTIKRLTGITFNGAAIIDFNGFRRVIDAIGGVDMCVDHKVTSKHMRLVNGKPMWLAEARKHGGGEPITYQVGCRHMAGWQALDYSRQRYGLPGGDYDRQRHQQQLVKAMVKGMMSKGVVTNPIKLDKVIRAAGKALTLDTGGVDLADFIFTLKGVAANDLVMLRTNGGKFNSAKIAGESTEALTEESMQMFAAAKNDTLAEFVLSHSDWVAKSS
ncbi:MAG: LCP family protein [Micromonosporaceae bacterium]|nr:LCP family protein [Micromonosporaceae bacterium]